MNSSCVAAILPAAGSGSRFGDTRNKLFAQLGGKPLWWYAATRLAARSEVGRILMAVSDDDREEFSRQLAAFDEPISIEWVSGGATRTDSVRAGLDKIAGDTAIEYVAVHDAARPFVDDVDITAVFAEASGTGAAILATPVTGTLKRDLEAGKKSETVDRRDLWIALTPQVFAVGLLNQAYQKHNGRSATDDAQLVERMGHDIALVRGSAENLKITYPEDLLVAESILARHTKHA